MGYMAGDYYAGDYYTGDYYGDNYAAGGLGSLFKGIAGVVKGAAKGFALGGPLGALAGARAGLPMPKASSTALQPKIAAPLAMHHLLGGRRRMNWANPRALSRAERRIHSAVKHMTKYIRWVHPTKAGHAVPRFRGRKKK